MTLDQTANFIRGSTDAAVNSTQTTVSVVGASIFPDPANGEYNVVIWDVNQYPRPDQDPDVEILRVTGVDTGTDELTVTRGQEGTSGASHPSGSAVHLTPTAKMFTDIPENFVSNTGDTVDGDLDVTGTLSESSNEVLTTADEGTGNGLDADTVDGFNASQLGTSFDATLGSDTVGDEQIKQNTSGNLWGIILRDFPNIDVAENSSNLPDNDDYSVSDLPLIPNGWYYTTTNFDGQSFEYIEIS